MYTSRAGLDFGSYMSTPAQSPMGSPRPGATALSQRDTQKYAYSGQSGATSSTMIPNDPPLSVRQEVTAMGHTGQTRYTTTSSGVAVGAEGAGRGGVGSVPGS